MKKLKILPSRPLAKQIYRRLFPQSAPVAPKPNTKPAPKPTVKSNPTLAELCAPLEDFNIRSDRRDLYDAGAQLAALAPCTTVAEAVRVCRTLAPFELWPLFAVYLNRLPEELQADPQIRMWQAATQHHMGEIDEARSNVHKALIAPNGYTVAGAALAILIQNFNVDELLARAVAEVRNRTADRDTLLFCLVLLQHTKKFTELEQVLEMTLTLEMSQDDALLTILRARAARAVGQLESAAELGFQAHEMAPEEGFIAITTMDLARLCPSDVWIEPAISLGEKMLSHIKNPNLVKQIIIALARLNARSVDKALALERLAAIEDLGDLLEAPTLAIARCYFSFGEFDRAYRTLSRYSAKYPKNATVIYNMAGILAGQDRTDEAIRLIETQVPQDAQDAKFHAIIGHIYAWSDQCDLARPWLKKALKLSPEHPSAIADMALCIELDRNYTLTHSLMEKASTLFVLEGPSPITGLEFMHLARLRRRMMFVADMTGNEGLARALQREAIAQAPITLPYPTQEWSGQSLAGKSVVVLAELGVGDEIRYTSVLHHFVQEAREVILTCDPRLRTLLERSFPSIRVMPVQREFPGIRTPRHDSRKLAVVESMRKIISDDLVVQGETADIWMRNRHHFEAHCLDRSRLYQSPDTAVLTPDPRRSAKYRSQLQKRAQGRRVIGLSWRGGRRTYNREPHYFRLEQWRPLLDDPELCFVNLQYAIHEEELDWLRSELGERFIEFPTLDLFDDMEGIAALCSQLDLVVSICTSVLELACAVGTPCLYLMRSAQVTHAIRLSGFPDRYGAYQDAVWNSCRIIPRFKLSDEMLLGQARGYIADFFQEMPQPIIQAKQAEYS